MATITKRNETYRITVSTGYDCTGKQIRRSMTWKPAPGMTKKQIEKEVNRQALLFEERVKNGIYLDGSIRFFEFAEKWFKDYAEKQLRATTLERYKSMLPRTNMAIGHLHLEKIQPHHLIAFYNNLAEEGMRKDIKYASATDLKSMIRAKKFTFASLAEAAHIGGAYSLNGCKRK